MYSEHPRQVSHPHATYLITIEIVTHWLVPTINNNNNISTNHSTTVLCHWFSKVYYYFTLIEYTSYCNNYFTLLDYYKLLQNLFHNNLNAQVITNSIVHVY